MADEVYWRSTPAELRLLLDAMYEREEAAERRHTLRAGLVTAAVLNTNRGRGQRAVQPADFLPRKVKVVSAEEFAEGLRSWAQAVNKRKRGEEAQWQ